MKETYRSRVYAGTTGSSCTAVAKGDDSMSQLVITLIVDNATPEQLGIGGTYE